MTNIASYLKNPVIHGIVTAILFAIPLFLLNEPVIANLTIGGILTGAAEWLKNNS
jgi:hypothetical protein